ncbi:unnamed protein product [Aphis gossypii]|uniref:THAP-type domain-containing protein n=1 Tax=Aphis gossypii TaxID=80765 RepID=A0A9P0IJ42_APHGO|nr:unnamed protein product [Aphis gossypii]
MGKCLLCNRSYQTIKHAQSKISFHSFPVNPDLRKKWIKKCGLEDEDILIKSSHKICSLHFTEDSYLPMFPKSKRLKPTAVPSFFMNSSSISVNDSNTSTLSSPVFSNNISMPTKIVHNSSTSSINTIYNPADESKSLSFCRPPTRKKLNFHPRYIGDCTEKDFSTPIRRKNNLIFVKNQYLLQTKKIKCLLQQSSNLKKKVLSLKSLLNELQHKYKIVENS